MGNSITSVQLGFLVGAIPTIAMLSSELALTNIEVNKYVEATFQNFAAGLILAAVAAELFPLMITEVTPEQTFIGVTVGFAVALGILNGLEVIIEYFSEEDEDKEIAAMKSENEKFKVTEMREMIVSKMSSSVKEGSGDRISAGGMNEDFVRVNVSEPDQHQHPKEVELSSAVSIRSGNLAIEEEFQELYKGEAGTPRDWEEDDVHKASLAIALPQHRSHLHEHVREVVDTIAQMEKHCMQLFDESVPKTRAEVEQLAEEIDERTHSLQYKLDHCRRLLQGSEVDVAGVSIGYNSKVTEEKRKAIERRLELLKLTGEHLIEHLGEEK